MTSSRCLESPPVNVQASTQSRNHGFRQHTPECAWTLVSFDADSDASVAGCGQGENWFCCEMRNSANKVFTISHGPRLDVGDSMEVKPESMSMHYRTSQYKKTELLDATEVAKGAKLSDDILGHCNAVSVDLVMEHFKKPRKLCLPVVDEFIAQLRALTGKVQQYRLRISIPNPVETGNRTILNFGEWGNQIKEELLRLYPNASFELIYNENEHQNFNVTAVARLYSERLGLARHRDDNAVCFNLSRIEDLEDLETLVNLHRIQNIRLETRGIYLAEKSLKEKVPDYVSIYTYNFVRTLTLEFNDRPEMWSTTRFAYKMLNLDTLTCFYTKGSYCTSSHAGKRLQEKRGGTVNADLSKFKFKQLSTLKLIGIYPQVTTHLGDRTRRLELYRTGSVQNNTDPGVYISQIPSEAVADQCSMYLAPVHPSEEVMQPPILDDYVLVVPNPTRFTSPLRALTIIFGPFWHSECKNLNVGLAGGALRNILRLDLPRLEQVRLCARHADYQGMIQWVDAYARETNSITTLGDDLNKITILDGDRDIEVICVQHDVAQHELVAAVAWD